MKFICLIVLCLCSFLSLNGQTSTPKPNSVKRYFYRDSIVAKEKWYGDDKKLDSLKTYYKTGELDEAFYYKNARYHGTSYKLNRKGEKITIWTFENGKILNREDLILDYNKKDEQKVKNLHLKLKEVKLKIKNNPTKFIYRAQLATIRQNLENYTLALNDFNKIQHKIFKISKAKKLKLPKKTLGRIYDAKGRIYSYYEMDNHSIHYKLKAIKSDPKNNRLIFNLGAYLYSIKAYRLSKIFLDKVLKKWPKHAFTHRVLAAYYTDFEEFEKAKHHIDIAFLNEKSLLKKGFGKLERDIRTLRGFISHNLGDSKSGIKDLKEAIKLNKSNSFAHRNLGKIYLDLGNYELACNYLKKAKELGYEKKHDRLDLQSFLEISCDNAAENKATLVIEEKNNFLQKPFIYPNPTKGELNVKNINYKNFNFLVFDYNGKTVKTGVSTNKSIDISNLPSGVYIVRINKGNSIETFRVIKE